MELEGKTALVTGSCHEGIGRSTALRLAREGANVVLNYGTHHRTKKELKAVQKHAERIAAAAEELGGAAIIQPADTRDAEQVEALVDAARDAFGRVDILVNNAGGGWEPGDYTDVPLDQWRDVLTAEIDGALLTMQQVVPHMRKQRWGRIVHLGMENATEMKDTAGLAPDYCLGKAARAWMTRAFGLPEFGRGITVNCIAPGPTEHMEFEDALAAVRGDLEDWHKRTAVNCHDVAEIIAFLCTDAARYISGNCIRLMS
ncbi:MAG: SDR family oxidoreductase [Candidatus Brocadiia bacterium]